MVTREKRIRFVELEARAAASSWTANRRHATVSRTKS